MLKNSLVPFSEAQLRSPRSRICSVLDWSLGVWDLFWTADRSDIDFLNSLLGFETTDRRGDWFYSLDAFQAPYRFQGRPPL